MRFDKVWVVARKDISEFRTNKYIMYSLVIMPLIMAIVLPVIYLAPFTLFSTETPTDPIDLNLQIDDIVQGGQFDGVVVENQSFTGSSLTNVIAVGCIFDDCNITNSLIERSFVGNSTVQNTVLAESNLLNVSRVNDILTNSVILDAQNENQEFLNFFLNFLLLFFVLIPAIIPTIIASYSFVGEKLNKSLEPLLATPTTDLELLAGKSLSIFLPSMLVTWLSFIPFVIIVDFLAAPTLGYIPLPNIVWLIGVFVLAPLFCLLSIFLNVIVSSRVNDVRASQQIGSLVVLPVVVFFIISLLGTIALTALSMTVFSLIMVIVDAAVLYLSLKVFQREEILVRWK